MQERKTFYGWYIVAASLFLIMLDGMLLYSFGVFLPYLNDDFGMSRGVGSSLFSFRSLVLAFSLTLAGKLVDKYDPRAVIFGGGLITAFGMFMSGYATTVWELYLYYGFVVGLGDGVLYITCVAIVSRWFVKRRAFAIGIVTTGVPLSGLITNPLTAWLINDFGFRNALFIIAGIVLLVSLNAFVLRGYPHEKNLKPYGASDDDDLHTDESGVKVKTRDWTFTEAIRSSSFWVLYSMYLLSFITFIIVVTQFYNFEIDVGISALAAAGPPAAIGIGSIIGRVVLSGLLTEMIDSRKVLFICYIFQGSSILLLLTLDQIWAFYIFGIMFGFFYSGCVPIFPNLLGQYFGLAALGTIYGFFGTSYSISAISGPIIAGTIHDITGSYNYAFIFAMVCCYLAAAASFFVKAPRKKALIETEPTYS